MAPTAAWLAWLAELEQEAPHAVLLLAEHATAAAARIARAALAEGLRESWTVPEAAQKLDYGRRQLLRWAAEGRVRGWDGTRAPAEAWKAAKDQRPRRGRPRKPQKETTP